MIYALCPLSRPEFLSNVVRNFEQQTCKGKRLIIVENGEAVGACEAAGFTPDVLLRSDKHQSLAKNVGLEWITSHGGGWFATFDDDDYYGPGYLAEALTCFKTGSFSIVGKLDHFVVGLDGHLRFFEQGFRSCEGVEAHGATLCGRAESCPRFQDTGTIGEDWHWLSESIASGARLWVSSPYHYAVVRHARNTWRIGDESYQRRLHVASQGACRMFDYGPWGPALEVVVSGLSADAPRREIYAQGDLEPEDSPAYVEMMKNSPSLEEIAKSLGLSA